MPIEAEVAAVGGPVEDHDLAEFNDAGPPPGFPETRGLDWRSCAVFRAGTQEQVYVYWYAQSPDALNDFGLLLDAESCRAPVGLSVDVKGAIKAGLCRPATSNPTVLLMTEGGTIAEVSWTDPKISDDPESGWSDTQRRLMLASTSAVAATNG